MNKNLLLLSLLAFACTTNSKELSLEEKLELIQAKPSVANVLDQFQDQLYDVDCSQLDQLLYHIHEADQEMRTTGEGPDDTDHQNLIAILSIIDQCGFPTLQDLSNINSRMAIPLVLQHQPNQDISLYFLPQITEGVKAGVFSPEIWARIVDRQLMFNGYKQVFGTNFARGQLYELEQPEKVQQRRDSVGLRRPFVELLAYHGLTLDEALANQFLVEEFQKIIVKPDRQ